MGAETQETWLQLSRDAARLLALIDARTQVPRGNNVISLQDWRKRRMPERGIVAAETGDDAA